MNIGEKLIQNFISGYQVDRNTLFHYTGIGTLISKRLLHENSTAIEVGIGKCTHNTLEYTKLFKKVYAIDAHESSYELIMQDIKNKKLNNLEAYHYFLSDKQETVQFHCSNQDIGYSTRYFDMVEDDAKHNTVLHTPLLSPLLPHDVNNNVKKQILPNWSTIEMQSTTLDDVFFDKVENLSFIKIDAESSDIAIIKGANKLIQKWRPLIQFEHLNDNPIREIDTPYIRQFCAQHKYQFVKNVEISSFILIPKKGK